MKTALLIISAALSGCATNPGVVPAGPGVFQISRSGYGFGESQANVMAKVLKEAGEHCAAQGKSMEQISADSRPAWPTHFPEAEVKFHCVP